MNTPARASQQSEHPKQKVFLVEDHPITREGLAQFINSQPGLEVTGHAASAVQALAGIRKRTPQLVVVDIALPGANGIELIKHLKAAHPAIPILVLSSHDESLYAERALKAGANGYVMKDASTGELMIAIREVLRGGIHLSDPMQSKLLAKHLRGAGARSGSDLDLLSDRELEVFHLIGAGRTTRQIAQDLNISVSTVETYRAHLKEKLHVHNGVELMRRAVEWVNAGG